MMICVLAGGVGASKFLRGLRAVSGDEEITAIVNTGDDLTLYGLRICPDIDTVTYTLAGLVNPETGWGVRDECYTVRDTLINLGDSSWFLLGDRDIGLHMFRTQRLALGERLSEVTTKICNRLNVPISVIPMSDTPVATKVIVEAEDGSLREMDFQEYFVAHRHTPLVRGVRYEDIETATPPREALDALSQCRKIIIAPSNPLLSIGPILAIDQLANIVRTRRSVCSAVSPLIGGKAVKGPAADILASLHTQSSATTVASLYQEYSSSIAIDTQDSEEARAILDRGITPIVTNLWMRTPAEESQLAKTVLDA